MPGITKTASPVKAGKALKRKELPQSLSDDAPAEAQPVVKKAKKAVASAEKAVAKPTAADAETSPSKAVGPKPPLSADAYRREHDITVKAFGVGTPPLWQSFDEAPFPATLQKALLAAGFTSPSPIQTGSGKTCGYLLPAMARYLANKPATAPAASGSRAKGSPAIVVMAPTRELAVQINQQSTQFARAVGLRSVAVYGGAPKGPQIRDLQSGAQIVIATPGRLNDLLVFQCHDGSAVLDLVKTTVLVLDEADRMCDMGFEEDIKKITKLMPASKQTLFFTATWPKAVARVAATILNNPIHVSIGSSDELRANKDIKQVVQVTDQGSKRDLLMALVKKDVTEGSRSIIFCNKKYICDELENSLWEAGYNVAAIHGDRSQQDREWAVSQIRDGKMPLLVATDVAARGLDIKGLDRVVNFDFPNNTEDYVHRIGRTGRAGASGIAHTFFTQADAKHASELVKIMREAKQDIPADLEALARNGGGGGRGRHQQNKWRGGGGGGGAKSWGRKW